MQKLLFELLQVATGQLDCLSKGPSPEEWNDIYQTARQHGLAGVSYIGVEHLFEYGLRVPQDLSLDWMADAEMIRERQELIDKRCQKLMEKLEERKIRSSVMNGLGMRQNGGSDFQQSLQAETIDIFVDYQIKKSGSSWITVSGLFCDVILLFIQFYELFKVFVLIAFVHIGINPL